MCKFFFCVRRRSTPTQKTPQQQDGGAKEADGQKNEGETTKSQSNVSPKTVSVQRAVSLPVSTPERYRQIPESKPLPALGYSQSERRPPNRERPKLERTVSRKEAIKNYIKKETANFFGVDEENEADQQVRWLDRRKRLASRWLLKVYLRNFKKIFGNRLNL